MHVPESTGNGGREASAAAYQRLRSLIVAGLLAPGSPLIETDLVARLGVSRTPVRAALLRLEQQGFVRTTENGVKAAGARRKAEERPSSRKTPRTNRRVSVSPLTVADLREVFLMVGALETVAARRATQLDVATRERLVAALENANGAIREAIGRRPPDLAAAEDAHERFHRAIVAAGAGARLSAEIEVLALQAERYRRAYTAAMMYAASDLTAAHDVTQAAIRAGDPDEAERATAADWRLMAERHAEMAFVLGERGNW